MLGLGPGALGLPRTVLRPSLIGIMLFFCRLKLRVLAHGLGVHPIQHSRESLAHAQHVRIPALLEVIPRRQVLECRHRKAF